MRPVDRLYVTFAGILLAALLCGACTLKQGYIRTQWAERAEITGNYTLILYGANHYNDIATVAFLVPEGGQYTFDIFAPDFNYRVLKGIPAKEALEMAEKFVSWHPSFLSSQTSKILDANGKVIGYEVRPLYKQVTFGRQDVMYVDYFPQDNNKVEVHITLYPDIEAKLRGGDGNRDADQ